MIIRHHYEKLYGNKMDNLEEMEKFLEKFNLLRLNQEETEIMSNPITSPKIEVALCSGGSGFPGLHQGIWGAVRK